MTDAETRRWWRWFTEARLQGVAAALISLLFGVRFGFHYGVDNQVVYLLGGLRIGHPELLANDWYVTQTTRYHHRFDYLVWLLDKVDGSGWSIGIANAVMAAAGAWILYWILTQIVERRFAFPAFLLLMVIAMYTRTAGFAVSYMYNAAFQPSTLGTVGLLAAAGLFMRGSYVASGVALALGGLFHANFAVLGFPVFLLAHLLLGRERREGRPDNRELLVRLAKQLAAPAVVLLILIPPILATAQGDVEAGRNILFHIRSPHHYDPRKFLGGFTMFAAWQLAAVGAGVRYFYDGERTSRFGAVFISLSCAVWSASLLTTVWEYPSVAQAFVWRLVPFIDILAQLVVCAAAVQVMGDPQLQRRHRGAALAALVAGISLIAILYDKRRDTPLEALKLVAYGVIAVLALRMVWGEAKRWLPRLRIADGLLVFPRGLFIFALCSYVFYEHAPPMVKEGYDASKLLHGVNKLDAELFDWARSRTDPADIFLTPPGFSTFRLHTMRSIVVDWKGAPVVPGELVEWERRLAAVAGMKRVTSGRAVSRGYDRIDAARVERLRDEYGIRYVVVSRRTRGRLRAFPVAFENRKWVVFDVAPKDPG